MLTLRPYQQEALDALNEHLRTKATNPCVVIATAGGKSFVMAEAIRRWKDIYPPFRVCVLAHRKELVDQNAKELKGIDPSADVGIYAAGLDAHETGHAITYASIDSVYNKAGCFLPFDALIIDECFPAGTKVSTPHGDVNIEDVFVGQQVYSAIGTGAVEATSAKIAHELIKLELENGNEVTCTTNHKLFTRKGWVRSDSISTGDVLFSREHINKMWIKEMELDERGSYRSKILRMLRKRNQTKMVRATGLGDAETNVEAVLEETSFLLSILRKESVKSDVDSGRARTGFKVFEKIDEPSSSQGRKRVRKDEIADGNIECTRGEMLYGVRYNNDKGAESSRRSTCVQGGRSNTKQKDCDPIGRNEPQDASRKDCGHEDDIVSHQTRVVSVSRVKLESPVVVYNLQVAGHPSYYANGVLVHNCHRIPLRGEGKYRKFIMACQEFNRNLRIIGFTATPYRLAGGPICHRDYILNEVCYETKIDELIRDGYLCPLRSKVSSEVPDLSSVKKSCGDYQQKSLGSVVRNASLVRRAVEDALAHINSESRRCCVWFCVDVEHCQAVLNELRYHGESAEAVTGETDNSTRDRLVDEFRAGRFRHLLNVNVFTEGFNVKQVDAVIMLRPTLSRALYQQMVGRGMRLHPDKADCLVLDYGHNIETHGPIDAPYDRHVRVEVCGNCREVFAHGIRKCPKCGWEIPKQVIEEREKAERERKMHEERAAQLAILGSTPTEYPVSSVMVNRHEKGGVASLCVTYRCGIQTFREWICLDHDGYARTKAEKWWRERFGEKADVPSVDEALQDMFLGYEIQKRTESITVKKNGKYNEIILHKLKVG